MLKIGAFLLVFILHCTCANLINIYNSEDSSTNSFAEYPVWVDTTKGVATLEFKFKTNSRSCVLLFVNDGVTRNGGMFRSICFIEDENILRISLERFVF